MKYKVLVLGLQAKRKTPYKSGDVVDESGFFENSVDKLISGGYIKAVGEVEVSKPVEVDNTTEVEGFDEITVKELKSILDEKQIVYSPVAKKAELYELYKNS